VVRVQRIHRLVVATSPPPVHGELFKMADSVPVSDDTPPTASASEASQARPHVGCTVQQVVMKGWNPIIAFVQLQHR
jgi:hypothetical protein